MNHKLLLFIVLFSSVYAKAQLSSIVGEVRDQEGLEVPFANILIFSEKDTLQLTGGMADDFGRFDLKMKEKKLFDTGEFHESNNALFFRFH